MENQLIELYLLAWHSYDTRSETCFQRLSNNAQPELDHIIDSVPVMLARGGHAYTARVAARCFQCRLLRQQKDVLSRRAPAYHRPAPFRRHAAARTGLAQRRQLS